MANQGRREFDIIVFGASGFTGKRVCIYLSHLDGLKVKWALAGRSESKLLAVRSECGDDSLPLIVADCKDHESMKAMMKRAKCVINCVGPYRWFGEDVVRAAVACGTDYVDLTGEPQFMASMQLKYDEEARESCCLVVPACGFDSIPADLGTLFASSQFPAPGCVSSVESFLSVKGGPEGLRGHYATFECAVHGFGDQQTLRSTRKQLRDRLAETKHPDAPLRPPTVGPKLRLQNGPYRDSRMPGWAIKFPGADAAVVRSSQTEMFHAQGVKEPFPQCAYYFTVPSTFSMVLFAFFGTVMNVMASFSLGRQLLLRFPGFFTFGTFSHAGPTQAQIDAASFRFDMFAKGYSKQPQEGESQKPDKEVHVEVTGPEPGYAATPIIVVNAALAMVKERTALPAGGVMMPGAAFRNSTLLSRLRRAGIQFNVKEE